MSVKLTIASWGSFVSSDHRFNRRSCFGGAFLRVPRELEIEAGAKLPHGTLWDPALIPVPFQRRRFHIKRMVSVLANSKLPAMLGSSQLDTNFDYVNERYACDIAFTYEVDRKDRRSLREARSNLPSFLRHAHRCSHSPVSPPSPHPAIRRSATLLTKHRDSERSRCGHS